jgi:hypothetical protein
MGSVPEQLPQLPTNVQSCPYAVCLWLEQGQRMQGWAEVLHPSSLFQVSEGLGKSRSLL